MKKYIILTSLVCIALQIQAQTIQTKANTSFRNNTVQNIKSIEAGVYYIKVNATGKYLGVEGVNTSNGARLVQWDFANLDNHKFYIERRPDGYYTIKAMHSNRYLNIAGQSVEDGAPVLQWDYVEQDNVFFNLLYSSSLNGWLIRGKQSGKDVKLAGGITNAANGTLLVLNSNNQAGAQAFSFEPAQQQKTMSNTNVGSITKSSDGMKAQMVMNTVSFNLPGGGKITRYINPRETISGRKEDRKSQPKMVNQQGNCNTYMANVSTVQKNEVMTISNGNLIENFAPGLIYDVKTLFNGDILNKEKFPYAQNRNPIQLTTSVKNFDGENKSILEPIEKPDRVTINQAIANFYARHTSKAAKTTMQNARFYSCAITSMDEFALKVGAGGHYLFFAGEANFNMSNRNEYKSLYFEATKELFTISARPATEEGFFSTDPGDISNLGFISSVTYGVRIIGKVDVENKQEAMGGSLKASFEMGVAGANVNMDTYTTTNNAKSVVTLYAVGGRCDKIGICTVENIQSTIDNFLRTVNYQVAQPIKLTFSTLDGQLMRFMDATDNFTYTECVPAALAQATEEVRVDRLVITANNPNNNDYDFYGKVWVMAYNKDGREIPAERGANMLMDVAGEQEIDLDNPSQNVFAPGTSVKYIFPNGSAEGAYLDIYYALFDQDAGTDYGTGDDDQFSFRNTDALHGCELGPTSRRLCRRRIYFNELYSTGGNIQDQLWCADDAIGVTTSINITRLKK